MTDDDLADFNAAVAAVLACDEPVPDTLVVAARFAPVVDALHRAHAAGDTAALDALREGAFALLRERERGSLLAAEAEELEVALECRRLLARLHPLRRLFAFGLRKRERAAFAAAQRALHERVGDA